MQKPIDIKLGDQTLAIQPLTFDQVEQIESIMAEDLGAALQVPRAKAIIAVALASDHPDVDIGKIRGCKIVEIADALTDILKLGGFMRGDEPGEATAAAGNAPTGDGSADASLQALA